MRKVAVVALVVGSLAARAFAADQTILGDQLLVKDPSTPEKRSFVGKAKEKLSANTIVGDPVADGATLTIRALGDAPTEQTFALPQATSGLTGKPFWSGDSVKGFKYKDSKGEQGPVKAAQIKKSGSGTFTIKVKGTGKYAAVDVLPPNLGTSGCMLLEMGGAGDSYSVAFTTGTVTNKTSLYFRVKKPTVEDTCVIVGPTTSTTSSSTTSTESTTSSTESTTTSTESTTSSTESTTSSTEGTTSSTTSSTSSTESTSTSTSSTTSTSTSSSSTSTSSSSSSSSTSSTTSTSSSSTTTSTLGGPTLPPDVGSPGAITASFSGAASAGDAGGRNITFTCVDTTWSKLYWGISSSALPGAGLDGATHAVTYVTASSVMMQWDGNGLNWTNPDTGITATNAQARMLVTITGGTPSAPSFALPPPGSPPGLNAVVDVAPSGTCASFTVKVEFLGNAGAGFVPINTIKQAPSLKTQSSFTGAFYWAP